MILNTEKKIAYLSGLFLVCFDIWTKSSSRSSECFKLCLYSLPTSSTRSSKLIGFTRSDESTPTYFKIIWNNFVARLAKSPFSLSNDVGIGSYMNLRVSSTCVFKKFNQILWKIWYLITFWKQSMSSNVSLSRTWGPTDLLEKNPRLPAD